MMIRDIFERVENFHADLAWNYPHRFLQRSFFTNIIMMMVSGSATTWLPSPAYVNGLPQTLLHWQYPVKVFIISISVVINNYMMISIMTLIIITSHRWQG